MKGPLMLFRVHFKATAVVIAGCYVVAPNQETALSMFKEAWPAFPVIVARPVADKVFLCVDPKKWEDTPAEEFPV